MVGIVSVCFGMMVLCVFLIIWGIFFHGIVTGIREKDYGLIVFMSVSFLFSIVVGLFSVLYLWS
ncbi:MAG: hypothetical protein WC877_01815 [Dehalococcoidales bacterium]|jgi:hypothetical protein